MTVTLPYDPIWEPLEWAKKYCPSYITNDIHKHGNSYDAKRIDYFFATEKDAMWFVLRWSS